MTYQEALWVGKQVGIVSYKDTRLVRYVSCVGRVLKEDTNGMLLVELSELTSESGVTISVPAECLKEVCYNLSNQQ